MSNSDVGRTFIFRLDYFGGRVVCWKVLRLARTKDDQENTTTGIDADNWRELQDEAKAYVLREVGTLDTNGAICPPELAERAIWTTFDRVNTVQLAGKE